MRPSRKILAALGDLNVSVIQFNPLNAELNTICHLLALLGAYHTLHVSRVRVDRYTSDIIGLQNILWKIY